ncbi:type IX secretion system sortase PorU [Pseudofulvibacter geojedonensis]
MKTKYYILLLLVSLFVANGHAQEKTLELTWEDGVEVMTSRKKIATVHGFQLANFEYNQTNKTIKYSHHFKIGRAVSERDFELLNVEYENLSSSKLTGYNKKYISNKIDVKIANTLARGVKGVNVSFSPIIKVNSGFKKVKSVRIKFKEQSSNYFRSSSSAISSSEMAQGEWYRFYIEKTGVYKLDKSFLSSLGVDVSNVNPQNIRLFGNGGKAIPLSNSNITEYDVKENAVKFVGEEDGVFNSGDYMLFYGVSAYGYDAENASHINPYSDKTYYYINVSNVNGRRINNMLEPSGAATNTITQFHEYQFHEQDLVNVVRIGRKWFGEDFSQANPNRNFTFSFPRLDTSQPINIKINSAGVSSSTSGSSMSFFVNDDNNSVGGANFLPINDIILARESLYQGNLNVSSTDISVGLRYNHLGNPSATGYLDFIAIEGVSFLRSLGRQFSFRNNDVAGFSGVGEYVISDAQTVSEVWDVTDRFNVTSKEHNTTSTFTVKATMGELREYVALVETDFYTPLKESSTSVSNSDIKGTVFLNESGVQEDVDYIVVTPSVFRAQAERLAGINKQVLGLRTRVYNLEDIYAEFNTGNQDIGAVRNFVKYVYDNATTDKLQYLCLFGDASYDMKDREPNNTNFVPSFHSLSSFSLADTVISDDFFGMMDVTEGTMASSDKLDIAVGRIVVNNVQQANDVITKIQQYYEKGSYGSWRNNLMVVSDDIDFSWEELLQRELDDMADEITANRPVFNVKKIHTDAYLQESSAGGELYPKAKEELITRMGLGVLTATYFGHGGEDGLAHERIFLKGDGEDLTNTCRYNVFITVTCDYAKFDNPFRTTAGEFMYWNSRGGAVNLISTTREIYAGTGVSVNKKLSEYMYDFANTGYVSVGEALRKTKNDLSNAQRRLVFCIGDPALRLAIPKPGVRLTKINDVLISDPNVDALEALGRVKISGEVVDENGIVITNPNGQDLGILSTTIFDKKQNRETLANDGVTDGNGLIKLNFETQGEIIFRGQSTIKSDGTFEFEFVVSRDILIPLGEGRISFYANMNNQLLDYNGYDNTIKVGGLNENAPEDNLGPTIQAFMNDESFVSGGTTGQSPFLLLKLEDDNGINTASGIGHDITAILDGDEANPFILNDYYETEPDDFTKGKVNYQFRDLSSGLHTLTIKAWDVYNNSATTEIQFVVVSENEKLTIDKVLNYPNPFVSYTEFWFTHNSTSELDVMVQIYTVSGKLIKTIKGTSSSGNKGNSASLSRSLTWDGKDDFGDRIGKGVYVYKLSVKSPTTNKTAVKYEKLVIL